jgi:hypothetical protein
VTLQLVSSVSEADHPSIPDAASMRLEVVSKASTWITDLEQGTEKVPVSDPIPSDLISSDIESLTTTELIHIVRRFMGDERRVRRVIRTVSRLLEKRPVEFDDAIADMNKIKGCLV